MPMLDRNFVLGVWGSLGTRNGALFIVPVDMYFAAAPEYF